MSYTEFLNKHLYTHGEKPPVSVENNMQDGIQVEFEDRLEAWALNGIISGLACSISTTNILIASGECYVEGRRFSGTGVVAFAGAAANTWYVYIDPTAPSAPYKKAIADPGAGYLVLCSVDWNGSDTLSNLVDLAAWGIVPATLGPYRVVGAVSAVTKIAVDTMPYNFWHHYTEMVLGTAGTVQDTIVDIHMGNSGAGPVTVFTTQTRRPTLAFGSAVFTRVLSGVPEANRKGTAGQVIQVDVDQVATGAADLAVRLVGRWY